MHTKFQAFITGSYAYGIPNVYSDIDLVLPINSYVINVLSPLAARGSEPPGSISLSFGNLNLIIPTSLESYEVWVKGTAALISRKPVIKEEAVDYFYKLRKAAGILD